MIMDIKAISALKADMPAVLRDIQENHNPVLVVSKGRPQAVLQDIASFQGTQDAIALLKIMLQSEQSVSAGRGCSTKKVIARLRARLKARTDQ
jgi:prevent-host-death family protein